MSSDIYDHSVSVMITGVASCNNLGVIRGLGRHGIPIILLDIDMSSMVRYSKYITKRVRGVDANKSEIQYINLLLDLGKQMESKCMIIPTCDAEVLALSKYKDKLELFYYLPIATFEVTQKLVDKKLFYELLDQLSVPHPKTFFPNNISDVEKISTEITYPYIVKPVYSTDFGKEFSVKSFKARNPEELVKSYSKAISSGYDVVIQEVIPGNEIYMFYTYFNKSSEPLAICGYDKLRQYPPDFGCGSLCKSAWRSNPISSAIKVLKSLEYHGIAEPEFKKDPRDGLYKLLEINARTSTENRLPAKCGVDIEYISYLDTTNKYTKNPISPINNIVWIDEFYDMLSCIIQIKKRKLGIKNILNPFKCEKEYAIYALDDPLPCMIYTVNIGTSIAKYIKKCVKKHVK